MNLPVDIVDRDRVLRRARTRAAILAYRGQQDYHRRALDRYPKGNQP